MIIEHPDRYELDLRDSRVVRCIVDFAFTLEVARDDESATIRISGPFALRRGGAAWDLDPEAAPAELGPALELSRTFVTSAIVQKNGELSLAFGDGSKLTVPNNDDYEAWTLTVADGPLVVSVPGGTVTVFRPPGQATTATS